MANNNFSFLHYLFFIYTISLQYLPGESLSRHATVEFDVSASLHRTLHVLSSDTVQTQEPITPQREGATSSFSLSLHPRSSLHKPRFDDYSALTLSRIARDSARVNSIKSKTEFALDGVDRSTLRPVANVTSSMSSLVYGTNGLETPLTSGAGQGSGEYFARLAVGQPSRQYYFVTDTGSDVSWLQCSPCSDCYQQSDPIYDPSGSSSYSSLSCDSAQCKQLHISGCQSGSCLYQVSYGDGSFTVGTLATETLTFGNSGSVNNVAIGCGHDNEGLFVAAAGLLGLGGGPLSLTSQLKAISFSYCLVDRDSSSSSTLEFNTGRPANAVTAPLLHNPRTRTYLYVDFHGFVVGGRTVEIPTSVFAVDESGRGGMIVDSGTAVTRLKPEAYGPLRDAFVGMAKNLPKTDSFHLFDTCYDLSGRQSAVVPTLGFLFAGGKTLQLPPENYLIPVNANGKYCFAFATTDAPLSIIGNVQQQGTRVSYDLVNSVVGFSPKNC